VGAGRRRGGPVAAVMADQLVLFLMIGERDEQFLQLSSAPQVLQTKKMEKPRRFKKEWIGGLRPW
jgi:hypothetical protein